jgi:predicted GNAT family acetyltransferase
MDTNGFRIVNNKDANRFELHVEGELASLATYREHGETIVFDHTETSQRFRGRGLAERLVRHVLEDVRTRGLKVVPRCWYVAEIIDTNPEYADLLAGSLTGA